MIDFPTIAKLIEDYRAKAEKTPCVKKPWAWAIYQTWKDVDAKEKPREKPRITNGDRIRAMTDEELAHLLHDAEEHLFTGNLWNWEQWIEWLKKEVEE